MMQKSWFLVAADDAAGDSQARADLYSNVEHIVRWHCTGGQDFIQGLPVYEFHCDVNGTAFLSDVVDRNDIGVV